MIAIDTQASETRITERADSSMPMWLLFAAMFYNTFVAIINAHVQPMGQTQVIACEALVLTATIVYVIYNRALNAVFVPLISVFMLIFTTLFIWVSVLNDNFVLKSLRDFVVIFVFYLLGASSDIELMKKGFRYLAIIITAFLLVEGFDVDGYVYLFHPASFFVNTRGIEALSINSSGLFRNSLGYEGRFSFSLFGQRRLSSLFLEQVSLANFAMVLSLFAATFWEKLKTFDKVFLPSAVIFMLLSNSSRTGTVVCILIVLGYWIFPRLPRISVPLTMPLILFCSLLLFGLSGDPGPKADDTAGRIGQTIAMLSAMDFRELFAGNPQRLSEMADNGYGYIIASQTVIGLFCFWLFQVVAIPARAEYEKRLAHGVALYIACNLLIGAAIFSIKVSAPLWAFVGCVSAQSRRNAIDDGSYEHTQNS